MASLAGDPLAALTEGVRYARIRAGRYYFLANAPDHFDARRLIYYELPWIKKLADPVFASLCTLQGDQTLSPEQCFRRLGLSTNKTEQQAIHRVRDLARRTREDEAVPGLFKQAIEWFPDYYGLIERALARILERMPKAWHLGGGKTLKHHRQRGRAELANRKVS